MAELNLAAGLLLKPLVLVLAAIAIARLWPHRHTPHAALFLAGFALFTIGELACASDVYLRARMTVAGETAHDALMAGAGGVLLAAGYAYARATYRCWNHRCRRYPACTRMAAECRLSDRYGPVPMWLLGLGALLALLPLFADARVEATALPVGWGGRDLGRYLYARTAAISLVEQRLLPLAAALLLIGGALRYRQVHRLDAPALWTAALGAGTLGFVYFRVTLVHMLPDAALAGFWEELIELASVGLFLVWWRRAKPLGRMRFG